MKIKMDANCEKLEKLTWGCEEFWAVVWNQGLGNALEDYLTQCYPYGIELNALNDVLRYNGDQVLDALGADFEGTIWEDQYCNEKA